MISLAKNKVAVRPLYDKDKTPGGLWIPDEAKERCDQGIVQYVGPDVKDVQVGDTVLFGGYAGTLVVLEDEAEYIILLEQDCICTLGDAATLLPGIYFKDREGNYFTATYEQVIRQAASIFAGTTQFKKARFKYNPMQDSRDNPINTSERRG